ncbi:MAG TPA: hypothetical protein VGL15_12135 [Vicinamibacteria bacterium]
MTASRPSFTLLAFAAAGLWPATVQAREDALPVRAGDRVRIAATSLSETPVEGKVVDIDRTSLRLELPTSKAPVAVPLSSIRHLDVSRGRRSKVGRGALIGGASAAAFMSALALIICTSGGDCGDGGEIVRGVAYVTVAGAAAGAAVGAAFHDERWELVPLERLRSATSRRGARIALRVRF